MKDSDSAKVSKHESLQILDDQPADIDKRTLLKWVPPMVTAIALPAHAQCTTCPCESSLVVFAPVPSKCAGPANALVGQATITITSDSDPIEITSITHNAPGTDTITLPALPASATSASGVDIGWQGPGSDAITCLPLNTITLTVTYNCGENTVDTVGEINITEVLAAAIP